MAEFPLVYIEIAFEWSGAAVMRPNLRTLYLREGLHDPEGEHFNLAVTVGLETPGADKGAGFGFLLNDLKAGNEYPSQMFAYNRSWQVNPIAQPTREALTKLRETSASDLISPVNVVVTLRQTREAGPFLTFLAALASGVEEKKVGKGASELLDIIVQSIATPKSAAPAQ